MKTTWFDEEPRLRDFIRQTAELIVRGFRRPWLTLFVALLAAGLVTGTLAFGKRSFAPRLVLRLVEGEGDPTTARSVKRRLGDYVREGIFTSEPLLELIHRHALYPGLARKNPRAALESFREDIEVDVYQNYFVEERAAGAGARSARVVVGYRSSDPQKALAVTRDLGALVERSETRNRREEAQQAAEHADRTRDALRVALERRSVEVVAKRNEVLASTAPNPASQVELVGLLGSLGALERDLDTATQKAASLELGAAFEEGGAGLRVEIADEARLPSGTARTLWLAFVGGLSFAFGLPLTAIAVGAFCTRSRV
jgi:hypothetical protein